MGGSAAPPHIGKYQILDADRPDGPCGIMNRRAATDEEQALLVGVTLLDDLLIRRQRAGVASRSREPAMGGLQFLNLARDLNLGSDKDDEIVTDPLEVADQV
jgi:hypothetical protein